ncbi:MAG: pyridoxal phosphate biosynthetic protein [Bdellovibrio sp.]|nr:MAG: pyridoxal phosphate biosynthetic protein [Bdellovibrio sp.]
MRNVRNFRNIIVTTGDLDGIGLEIAVKSLRKIRVPANQRILLFCGPNHRDFSAHLLAGADPDIYNDLGEALNSRPRRSYPLTLISNRTPPPLWVEEACRHCLRNRKDVLVTGPLSKPLIVKTGLKDLGHTDILSRLSGKRDLFMSFWGPELNVVLLTGHLPLAQVEQNLTARRIRQATSLAAQFVRDWMPHLQKKPGAILGVNPHAGDLGLIGNKEKLLKNVYRQLARAAWKVEGPLPGDSAFLLENRLKYSVFFASYHDQGLIPFKLLHGFNEGVHVTLGLPFLRASVDHGPAKEIFGLNKANCGSMINALKLAIESGGGGAATGSK